MKAYIYQFADGSYGKGKHSFTTDISKARMYKQRAHALTSRGHANWMGKYKIKWELREGDKIIELNMEVSG